MKINVISITNIAKYYFIPYKKKIGLNVQDAGPDLSRDVACSDPARLPQPLNAMIRACHIYLTLVRGRMNYSGFNFIKHSD